MPYENINSTYSTSSRTEIIIGRDLRIVYLKHIIYLKPPLIGRFFILRGLTKLVTCSPWTRENAGSTPATPTNCSVSEVVNTSDFLSGGKGSIPLRNTNYNMMQLVSIADFDSAYPCSSQGIVTNGVLSIKVMRRTVNPNKWGQYPYYTLNCLCGGLYTQRS